MTKLTAENLYNELLKARSRHSTVQMHLNHSKSGGDFHLVGQGSGVVPLQLPPDVVSKLLFEQVQVAAWAVRDLEKKVEIINKMLEEVEPCQS